MSKALTIHALTAIPDVRPGDDLAELLYAALVEDQLPLVDGDILVIAHKVVSKAEGRIVRLAEVTPDTRAKALAAEVGKDPRKVQVILNESSRILRAVKRPGQREGILIAEHRLGFICANAAVDESNVDADESVILLPVDPDRSARAIREALQAAFDVRVGIVITDTFGRPWRMGHVNVAVGLAGVPALIDLAGERDAYGRLLAVTAPALSDELAAASGLLMTKAGKRPALLFRGLEWTTTTSSAGDLVRPQTEDLFR